MVFQVLATLYLRVTNAAKDDTRQERVLVDLDLPETHQMQYHTADFGRSKSLCETRVRIVGGSLPHSANIYHSPLCARPQIDSQ